MISAFDCLGNPAQLDHFAIIFFTSGQR
jgi:hypothetical protein